MAASIHLNLNALFGGNLSREDELDTLATIEDNFCFDSGDENDSDTDGKYIHTCYKNNNKQWI